MSVVAESLSDAMVMEDSESDGRLADSTRASESDGCEVFGQTDNLVNQFVTSETGPWHRGGRFTERAENKYKMIDPSVIEIADLV